jgi:hypothetical protein
VTAHGLELLNVLIEAAITIDQQDPAVIARCGDADRSGQI